MSGFVYSLAETDVDIDDLLFAAAAVERYCGRESLAYRTTTITVTARAPYLVWGRCANYLDEAQRTITEGKLRDAALTVADIDLRASGAEVVFPTNVVVNEGDKLEFTGAVGYGWWRSLGMLAADYADDAVTLPVAGQAVGTMIRIRDEFIRVDAEDEVTRGVAGTTAAAYTTTDEAFAYQPPEDLRAGARIVARRAAALPDAASGGSGADVPSFPALFEEIKGYFRLYRRRR